jgi:hypothetical protein
MIIPRQRVNTSSAIRRNDNRRGVPPEIAMSDTFPYTNHPLHPAKVSDSEQLLQLQKLVGELEVSLANTQPKEPTPPSGEKK